MNAPAEPHGWNRLTRAREERLVRATARLGAGLRGKVADASNMTPALQALQDEHSSMTAPKRPVIAGIDAGLVATRTRAIATLAEQVARTVEWAACMDSMVERGCRIFMELGPGRALSTMMLLCFAWRPRLSGVQGIRGRGAQGRRFALR